MVWFGFFGGRFFACPCVNVYSSLEYVRIDLPRSLSGELENCRFFGWRKTFLTMSQKPVWSPPFQSFFFSDMFKEISGSMFPPSHRQYHNFPLIFLILTLFSSLNSEVVEQGVLSTLQEGSQRVFWLSLTSVTCSGSDSPVLSYRYLMALGMGSLFSLSRSSPEFQGMFECAP